MAPSARGFKVAKTEARKRRTKPAKGRLTGWIKRQRKRSRRIALWLAAVLIGLPLGLTLLYSIVPPPVTPLMLIRLVQGRSEEHTSELQSRGHLVCRLLLEKKK